MLKFIWGCSFDFLQQHEIFIHYHPYALVLVVVQLAIWFVLIVGDMKYVFALIGTDAIATFSPKNTMDGTGQFL